MCWCVHTIYFFFRYYLLSSLKLYVLNSGNFSGMARKRELNQIPNFSYRVPCIRIRMRVICFFKGYKYAPIPMCMVHANFPAIKVRPPSSIPKKKFTVYSNFFFPPSHSIIANDLLFLFLLLCGIITLWLVSSLNFVFTPFVPVRPLSLVHALY